MLPRRLEPEVMDSPEEDRDYDAMDHAEVNRVFVEDFLAAVRNSPPAERLSGEGAPLEILDAGTGTAQIPIELCRRLDDERKSRAPVRIKAIDLAGEMLKLAGRNAQEADCADRIALALVDAKALPDADGSFDAVMSNSIVHHIPEPIAVLRELVRVLRPGGILFVRDLLRPPDAATLQLLVSTYAGDENPHQQRMFADSLRAALTLDEVRQLLVQLRLAAGCVQQTSDRHWTASCVRG